MRQILRAGYRTIFIALVLATTGAFGEPVENELKKTLGELGHNLILKEMRQVQIETMAAKVEAQERILQIYREQGQYPAVLEQQRQVIGADRAQLLASVTELARLEDVIESLAQSLPELRMALSRPPSAQTLLENYESIYMRSLAEWRPGSRERFLYFTRKQMALEKYFGVVRTKNL